MSTYKIPVGPIHPALKEPIMIEAVLDGEKVVGGDVVVGQNHRGIEWIGMNRNNPVQSIYTAERVCGICSACHPWALVNAVEKAAGIEVPERAMYIRAIMAEIERIHSHILWAGVAAHEIGFDSLLHLSWRYREKIMDLIEYLSGNRKTYAVYMIGGTRQDFPKEMHPRILEACQYYRQNFNKLKRLFLDDKSIKMRSRNIGILTKEDALKLMVCGPTGRASGVEKDVRADQPYGPYADMNVKAITPDILTGEVVGDVYDRIIVRLLEVVQSIDIIEQCMDMIPDGPVLAEEKIPKLLATLKSTDGRGVGRVEAPRGECIHYVRLEKGNPHMANWKIRAPTYVNIQGWIPMLAGEQIADIPIVAASIDPCMSCTNRVVTTDLSGKEKVFQWEELHKKSIEKTRRMIE